MPDDPKPGKPSRLEQEIDEILSRSHAEDLRPPPRPKTRRTLRSLSGGKASQPTWTSLVRPQSGAFWMIGAIVLAFLAVLVSDASPLLARLLVLAAVISFIVPILSRFRHQGSPADRKMWRGQVMNVSPSQSSPFHQIRDWWQNRTRR